MASNILWIMADELRCSALNCLGGAWAPIATPNIDALAAQGTTFARHYCNSPACVPSRCSILTARAPERTGVMANEGGWASFPLPVRLATFPEHFARAGYRTASIGKAHLPRGYTPWQHDDPSGSGMGDFARACAPERLEAITPAGIRSPVGGG